MRSVLSSFLLIFFSGWLAAQTLLGPLWLESQSQVDSFPLLYPDIKRIGTLIVAKDDSVNLTDIHDLSPLAQLDFVNSLYISNNGPLQTLDGLQGIDTLEFVTIFNNPSLQSLYGLHETRELYGLSIRKNNALPNLQGLNKLRRLDGMTIERCANLTSLSGADSLDYVFGSIRIIGNPRLKSVSGFPNLDTVGLLVTYNDSLLHFGHFPKMMNFGMGAHHNPMLQDFSELPPFNPGTIIGIAASNNASLTSFTGCETVPRIGMYLYDNPILEEVTAFDYVSKVGCNIQGPAIRKICFPNADTISTFEVNNCPRLKALVNALPNADTVSQHYKIYQNDSLYLIHEDQGPKRIHSLYIHDNPRLEYITGFEAMESTVAGVSTSGGYEAALRFLSPKFSEISGFNNLKTGSLDVIIPGYGSFNADPDIQFEKIEGFSSMQECPNRIKIWSLDTLSGAYPRRLVGFQQLETIKQELYINRVRDTLSAFQSLENFGPTTIINGDRGEMTIFRPGSCWIDPAAFAKLKTVINSGVQQYSWATGAIPFPALESCPNSGIGYSCNYPQFPATDTSLVGLLPKLKNVRSIGITQLDRLHSLDGLQTISTFAAPPVSVTHYHISIYNCDSLTDCSALCYVLKNATFSSPSTWKKVWLEDNPPPCDNEASIELWCDSLSSTVEDPAAWEGRTALRAFPNPLTAADLTLQFEGEPSPGPYEVRVADAKGRVVYTGRMQFFGKLGILPTGGLAPGWHTVYLGKKGEPLRSVKFVRN